ncbi:MAG: GTP-binding protein, partial [Planctomycetes bacterium]|nr:GTP-binding protein [Planctomycetota bacterium]
VEAEAEVPPLQPARKDLPKKSLPAPKPLGKKPAPKKDDHEAEVEAPPVEAEVAEPAESTAKDGKSEPKAPAPTLEQRVIEPAARETVPLPTSELETRKAPTAATGAPKADAVAPKVPMHAAETETSPLPAAVEPVVAHGAGHERAPAAETPPPIEQPSPAVESVAASEPASPTPVAQAPSVPPTATPDSDVRRLLVPQKKATVVGRIELPQETIRDARSRSAPAGPRDLRRQALQKMQQRTGMRPTPQAGGLRRPPAGPGGMRGGARDQRSGLGGPRKARPGQVVDPNKIVEVEEPVSMKALSEALGVKVTDLLATFMFKLKIAGKNINSMLTNEEVELVGLELERNIKIVEHKEAMDELMEQLVEESEGEMQMLRAPVVTFMGHVDHGKTSLMDALRDSDVAKHEAGGITQHIGAYKVTNEDGQSIVILDTPGHAAFTAMRARGAQLTDVVVLVVAADDGVMPQTEEAINHAKAANVPIVVAITKCDLPSAKPKQVKQQLMIKGLQSEDFGGTTGMVEVSAVKGTGLAELVERIHLESEILDLRARPDAAGKGIVVESRQSPEQGVVVTLLVTDGTLRLKDQIVCGESFARVRAMIDDHGESLEEAGPSTPITVFGLDR